VLYYKVGKQTYYTNVDALAAFTKDTSQSLELKLKYKFIDNTALWRKEPPLHINHYADMNARILRDRYDRLELRYSGGTDSQTVLRSFIRANVKIAVHHMATSTISKFTNDLYDHNKKDFERVAKLDNVTEFKTHHAHDMSQKEFEKALKIYHGHVGTALQNTGMAWMFGNDNCIFNLDVPEKNGYVFGKEKPHLVIKDGWWNWTVNDAMFSDCHWNFEKGDMVWFWFSDDVPEIQIKLTHLHIRAIEEVARIEKVKITKQWLEDVQRADSKWYNFILAFCGYEGLNPVLNSVKPKLSDPAGTRVDEYRKYNDKKGITNLYAEYGQDIKKNLRSDFYELGDADPERTYSGEEVIHVAGVWTKPIRVKPVSSELLPGSNTKSA